MNKPHPWPVEAVESYQKIKDRITILEAALTIALEEGVGQESYSLIATLNETLDRRAREIRRHCNQIARLLPDDRPRGSRYPKWYTTTIGIWGEADKLIEISKEIKAALVTKERIYIRALLRHALNIRARAEDLLAKSPKVPDLDVLEQVKRVVEEPPDSDHSGWRIEDIRKRLDELSGKK